MDLEKTIRKIVKEQLESSNIAFHITSKRNLKSIMKKGLLPRVPQDYGDNGDLKGVYLFKTLDDTKNALYNWLGERIDEMEEETGIPFDEVCLKIDISGLEDYLIDSVEYEWTCITTITPERIIEVFDI